jgi:hypothetical protein
LVRRRRGLKEEKKQLIYWLLIVACFILLIVIIAQRAGANENRPCGLGGNRHENKVMARCLSKQPGIQVRTVKALRIGNCESGFYAKADGGPYEGVYQLGHDEFNVFQHQGPIWVDQEFREYDYKIHSARGNVLAAFAHAHDHGWGAWSCQ